MKIISIEGCHRCEILKKRNKNVPYIELPSCDYGLGDTIYRLLRFLSFKSCQKCKIRQSFLNKLFPYIWNKKISKSDRILKNKLLKLNIGLYPILMDDELTEVKPIYLIDKFFNCAY